MSDQLDRFVERQVSSGRYRNASDALHLLKEREREAKLKALRRAAAKGFDQIDRGQGNMLKGTKAVSQFVVKIEAEVRSKRPAGGV